MVYSPSGVLIHRLVLMFWSSIISIPSTTEGFLNESVYLNFYPLHKQTYFRGKNLLILCYARLQRWDCSKMIVATSQPPVNFNHHLYHCPKFRVTTYYIFEIVSATNCHHKLVAFEDDDDIRDAWISTKVSFIYNVKHFDIEKDNKQRRKR